MLTIALEAARRAGEVLLENFGRSSLRVEAKGAADFVTDVDRRAEEAIRRFLEQETPENGLLLEEGGAAGGAAELTWVVDPLDGTTNYIHRYPFFCVSIALCRGDEVLLGVVLDPIRNEVFSAEGGEASLLNGIPLRVSSTSRLERALLATGFPFRSGEHLDGYLACFRELHLGSGGMRRDGSAALDLAYVAAGRYDAFWELGLMPWDSAAGSLLVAAAGGRVTDFQGGSGMVAGGDLVASNGAVHEPILRATRRCFPARPARR